MRLGKYAFEPTKKEAIIQELQEKDIRKEDIAFQRFIKECQETKRLFGKNKTNREDAENK